MRGWNIFMSTRKNNLEIDEIRKELKNKDIHIIPYSHADYAWTHYRQWHEERYIVIINEVLDIMKENSDYTWMTDNLNHILKPFLKYCPSRIDEFIQRVQEGRLEIINGIAALVRPTQVGDETFIRNIILGKKALANMIPGLNIEVYGNADVSVGHTQLPQLLKLGGYKYYWFWRPQGVMDFKGIPGQFIWEGLDGTMLLCARGSYNGLCGLDYMKQDFEHDWESIVKQFYNKELAAVSKRANVPQLWIINGMDDTRPLRDYTDESSPIPEFIQHWNKKEESRMSFSLVRDYFSKVGKYELPIIKDILDPCDVAYNMPAKGNKGLWSARRELDRLLVKTEVLCSMASIMGAPYPEEEIETLWQMLLGISGHAQEFVFNRDFEELRSMSLAARYRAEELIDQAKFNMTMRISENPLKVKNFQKQLTIFNVLNWEREDIIFIHISQPKGGKHFKLVDQNGKEIPYQVKEVYRGDVPYSDSWFDEIDILAKVSTPPLGYSTINIIDAQEGTMQESFNIRDTQIDYSSDYQIINTGELIVQFREGRIIRIEDSQGICLYERKQNDVLFNDIKFTRVKHNSRAAWLYWEYEGTDHFQPDKWTWEEYGPLRWKIVVEGSIGINRVYQEIVLYKGKRHIDFNVTIDCMDSSTGFFSADFPSDKETKIVADIPFGIEERDIMKEPYGRLTERPEDNIERISNKGLFYAKSWIHYCLAEYGNALISENCGNYFKFDENAGAVSVILTRVFDYKNCSDWMKHSHPSVDCRGRNHFKYSVCMNVKEEELYSVMKLAKEKAFKLDVTTKLGQLDGVSYPCDLSMLDMLGDSVMISAFYKEGDQFILRVYEGNGKKARLKIKSYVKLDSVRAVDFLGCPVDRNEVILSSDGCIFETDISPWEIVNLALTIKQ